VIEKTEQGLRFVEPANSRIIDHDAEYWAAMSLEAKWTASWDMTVLRHFMKGGTSDGLKMDKTKFWIGPIEEGEARD
jgi:hypothetical protein